MHIEFLGYCGLALIVGFILVFVAELLFTLPLFRLIGYILNKIFNIEFGISNWSLIKAIFKSLIIYMALLICAFFITGPDWESKFNPFYGEGIWQILLLLSIAIIMTWLHRIFIFKGLKNNKAAFWVFLLLTIIPPTAALIFVFFIVLPSIGGGA